MRTVPYPHPGESLLEEFLVGLQMDYDAAGAKDTLAKALSKIEPWHGTAANPRPSA